SLRGLTFRGFTPDNLLPALENIRKIEYLDIELWMEMVTQIEYPSKSILPSLKMLMLAVDVDAWEETEAFTRVDLFAFLGSLLSASPNLMAIQLQRMYYVNDERIGVLAVPKIVDLHGDHIQILDFDNVQLLKDHVELIYCRCPRLEALSFVVLESRVNLSELVSRSTSLKLLRVRVGNKNDITNVESGLDRMTALPRKLLLREAARPEFWRFERMWHYNPELMQPERTFTSEWIGSNKWDIDMEDMIATFRI
ncbi:hypothetical protein FRC17_009595, partial [Serendipita sp. 399]